MKAHQVWFFEQCKNVPLQSQKSNLNNYNNKPFEKLNKILENKIILDAYLSSIFAITKKMIKVLLQKTYYT